MSVQNGERLATKQDLADMYQSILPYLGGMPEMLANKFSKGDLYDTSEKMIGKWVDGKPVYQKVITGLVLSFAWNSTKNTTVTVSPLISNVEKILGIIGIKDDGTEFGDIAFFNDGNKWNLYSEHGLYVNTLVIKYTKSTDSANSFNIGEATDYSTEEKIVGTWIDGKPLYQRSVSVPSNVSVSSSSAFVDIVAFNMTGCIPKNITLPRSDNAGNLYMGDVSYFVGANANGYIKARTAYGSVTIFAGTVITVQYTKTTD